MNKDITIIREAHALAHTHIGGRFEALGFPSFSTVTHLCVTSKQKKIIESEVEEVINKKKKKNINEERLEKKKRKREKKNFFDKNKKKKFRK